MESLIIYYTYCASAYLTGTIDIYSCNIYKLMDTLRLRNNSASQLRYYINVYFKTRELQFCHFLYTPIPALPTNISNF